MILLLNKGKNCGNICADKHAQDIDPLWFFLVFLDCFPNAQGLPGKKVLIKLWVSYLIQIDASTFQSNDFVCACGD